MSWHFLFLPFYNKIPIILKGKIAIVIAIEIGFALLVNIPVCKVFKMKAQVLHFFPCHFAGRFFGFRKEHFQYPPVLNKGIIDSTDIIITAAL